MTTTTVVKVTPERAGSPFLTLETVDQLGTTIRRGFTLAYVTDPVRGKRFFNYFPESENLTPDGGTVFAAQDGGYWVGDFEGDFDLKWFDNKCDGITDDTVNFLKAENYAFSKGLRINLSDYKVLLSDKIDLRVNLIGNEGSEIILKAASTTTYFIKPITTGIQIKNVKISGNNNGTDAIKNEADIDLHFDNVKIQSFEGNAIYSLGPTNVSECEIDDCGRYSDKHAVYVLKNSNVYNNKITNSKYKSLIVGQNGFGNDIFDNDIDTTTGAASVGIYLSLGSHNNKIRGNRVINTVDSSIKATQETYDNQIYDNDCDFRIMVQGTANTLVSGNKCSDITDAAHYEIPSFKNTIENNKVENVISLGGGSSNLFGHCDQTRVIGNESGVGISGPGGSYKGLFIKGNKTGYIRIFIDRSLSPDVFLDETVKVMDNDITHNEAAEKPVRVQGQFFEDQPPKLIFSGNKINNLVDTDCVAINYIEDVRIFNNEITGGTYSINLWRIKNRCRIFSNTCKDHSTDQSIRMRDSESSTYWMGLPDDYFIFNNDASVEPWINGRFKVLNNVTDLYVSAIPTTGWYRQGTVKWLTNPTSILGYVCVTSGEPGTWRPFGSKIAASADSAAAVSATYDQLEVQAILDELRDLKTKMRANGALDE